MTLKVPVVLLLCTLFLTGCQSNKSHPSQGKAEDGSFEIYAGQTVSVQTYIDYVDSCGDLPEGLKMNTEGVLSGMTQETGSFSPRCVGVSNGKRARYGFVIIVRKQANNIPS